MIQVLPLSSPQDEATTDLVHRLRDDIIASNAGNGGAGNGANPGLSSRAGSSTRRPGNDAVGTAGRQDDGASRQ